jgi:hypothetical protein
MRPCPPREQLELLTCEKLGPADQAAVKTHVHGCAACQQTLAALSPHQPTEAWQPTAFRVLAFRKSLPC